METDVLESFDRSIRSIYPSIYLSIHRESIINVPCQILRKRKWVHDTEYEKTLLYEADQCGVRQTMKANKKKRKILTKIYFIKNPIYTYIYILYLRGLDIKNQGEW